MKNNKSLNKIEDFLLSYWKGEKKLWKAFWVMGFVFQILFFYFLLFLLYIGKLIGLTWSIKITIFLLSNIYTIWILVSIWNCSDNVKYEIPLRLFRRWGFEGKINIWGFISRVIVVLNIILIFLIYTGILSIDYQSIIQKNP